jgi:hypothetical protein
MPAAVRAAAMWLSTVGAAGACASAVPASSVAATDEIIRTLSFIFFPYVLCVVRVLRQRFHDAVHHEKRPTASADTFDAHIGYFFIGSLSKWSRSAGP